MSSIAKSSISLSKKDLTKSRKTLIASRSIVFYHKAAFGQLTIDLNSLSMPSEMPTQVQATAEEISSAQLAIFKKNLSLTSSANGLLVQGLHYLVVDSYTINLIGPYATVGAEDGEIFVGTVTAAPMSDLTVVSTQDVVKTYTLAIGETTLNLAQEYQIGLNPLENIGSMKIWVNGVLALRDIDYQEVEAGDTGYGSTIEFLSSPVSIDWNVVVDFGVRAITDTNAMAIIEEHAGAIKKIADDLAVVAGTNANDYLTANPSEIERRTFGNIVLGMLDLEIPVVTEWVDFPSVAVGDLITATGTQPTYGTVEHNRAQWRRVGSNMEIRWDYRQSTVGTAGTGNYLLNLPPGYQIDSTKVAINAVLGTTTGTGYDSISLGHMNVAYGTGTTGHGIISAYSATQLKGFINNGAASVLWGPSSFDFAITNLAAYSMRASIPILGWEATTTINEMLGL